jgi:hypothetical protein
MTKDDVTPENFQKIYIVLPIMEQVPNGLQTREERGSLLSERTGPPVGSRPLSTILVTPAPCWADPAYWPSSRTAGLRQTQVVLVFARVPVLYARSINRARHTA